MPLLEIEQKFSFTLSNITTLFRKGGSPPFKTLSDIHTQIFSDTYYDSHFKLSNAGLWLRKRHLHPSPSSHLKTPPADTVEWEAKQRMHASTILRSTFHETKDLHQIRSLVRSHFPDPGARDFANQFGLTEMAGFETHRVSFLADGRFTVVLDATGFGHRVGEVELMAEDEDAEKAHGDIERFCREYAWFFDTEKEKPKGKLTAYFERFGAPKWEM